MIKHTVFFKLKHAASSPEETQFLKLALELAQIPEVRDLECVKQVGKKNSFTWGLLMGFDDQDDYDRYNNHPAHVHFVTEHWLKEVEDFLEIDYAAHTV